MEEDGPRDLGPNQPFGRTKPSWVTGSAVLCSPFPLQKQNLTANLKGLFPPRDMGPKEHFPSTSRPCSEKIWAYG